MVRKCILLAASYVFYAAWDWRFLILIWFSSCVDYICGLRIATGETDRARVRWLRVSVFVNLSLLAAFKYFNFFAESAISLFNAVGLRTDWATLNIVLPVGISFYTFQTLSYTIDVYRRRCRACDRPIDFFLFVAFFPQLVAGPIEKASHLLPQLRARQSFDPANARYGLRCMLYGYLLKCVMADNLSPVVDASFRDSDSVSGYDLLCSTYLFAFQIYGDFAGYTWIAIGTAALFGIRLTRNFQRPYLSQSPREFWQRWHITLSSWFAEYVYVALLGGNRLRKLRRLLNVLATFLLSGLWHGANWTFVIWGAVNGMLYFVPPFFPSRNSVSRFLNTVICFHLICLTWVFFRAKSLSESFVIIYRVFTWAPATGNRVTPVETGYFMLLPLILISFEAAFGTDNSMTKIDRLGRPSRWLIYSAGILTLFFLGAFGRTPFIYFQF
ncbi:MAG: MBOAT family O-acyltransferase [Fuerstiella sp.]|nr:MBOAT family O-acyltransferase [Fuerstiella sp.]